MSVTELVQNSRDMKPEDCIDYYTPDYAIDFILPFLEPFKDKTAWECCCGKGNISRYMETKGFQNVVTTDIWMGDKYNFLNYEPPVEWDFIITNPPFRNKIMWLRRAFELGKPFAMLLPMMALDSGPIRELLKQHGEWGIVIPNRTIHYIPSNDPKRKSRAFFQSAWWCYKIPGVANLTIL